MHRRSPALPPRTVSEPPRDRRATMRSCIGVRSCASSTITCPNTWGSSSSKARASSSSSSIPPQREPCSRSPQRCALFPLEDALGRVASRSRDVSRVRHELVGRAGRPDLVEPAREESLGAQRALDLGEVVDGEALEAPAVVLRRSAAGRPCGRAPRACVWDPFSRRGSKQFGDLRLPALT